MRIAAAVLCGFFMDLCLGDPDWMPHPVIYMGKAISALEKFLRRKFPDTQKGLLMAGAALAAILPLGSFLMAAAAIYLAGLVHPVLAFLLETLWCWQALAVKGLYTESMRVKKKLEEQDLPGARSAVARIVGRDTQNLDAAGVAKAAIETVAENFSDGVAAPLFYLVIGGAPLGLCYKAINTMDSMVGYKNDRYLYFGRRCKLYSGADFSFFDDVCSASDRTERKACVSNLEARPLQSRKPEFRPDRKCGGRSTGHPACRGCMVFWEAGKKADDWRGSAAGGSSRYYAD